MRQGGSTSALYSILSILQLGEGAAATEGPAGGAAANPENPAEGAAPAGDQEAGKEPVEGVKAEGEGAGEENKAAEGGEAAAAQPIDGTPSSAVMDTPAVEEDDPEDESMAVYWEHGLDRQTNKQVQNPPK